MGTGLVLVFTSVFSNTASWAEDLPVDDPSKGQVDLNNGSVTQYLLPIGGGTQPKTRASNWSLSGALKSTGSQTVKPPAGAAGTITTSFSSNLVVSNINTLVTVSGNSSAKWWGSSPYNASAVGLTDQIWANSLSFTGVSVGSGWGVSLGGVTATATFGNEVPNNWANIHSYSGVQFSGLLINVNQNATASFRFGSTTFFQVVN